MNKKKSLIITLGALFYFGSVYMCFKMTSYFYVDAGYGSVLAEQVHLEAVATHLKGGNIRLAEEYILDRIEANDAFLGKAEKNESLISERTREKIRERLKQLKNQSKN